MSAKTRQLLLLARLTALETLRQPICLLLTVLCLLLMSLLPLTVAYEFGEEAKLVRDSALAIHFLFGLLIGGYAACSALSKEIRSGTASTVLSKSVGRSTFFLAKLTGIVWVVGLFSLLAALGTLLSDRAAARLYLVDERAARLFILVPVAAVVAGGIANYWRRKPFVTQAFAWLTVFLLLAFGVTALTDRSGHWVRFGTCITWRIVPASLLVSLSLVPLAAIALSLATRLSTVPTLALSIVAFLLGLLSDHLFGTVLGPSGLGSVLGALLPNLQHFWLVDALNGGGSIPWSYVGLASVYAAVYTAGVVLLGVGSFLRVEISG